MVSSRLVELGQRAFDAVAAGVTRREPLVKCQLLASEIYDALKHELGQTLSMDDAKRATLIAATNRCERAAIAGIDPDVMLNELGNALALLTSDSPTPASGGRSGPFLRVIEGGLSPSKSAGAIFSSSAVRLERDRP
jgi:hypothetical protein